MYKLTKEGKKYIKNGLPELKLIESKETDIKKLKEKIDNFNIAIQWAKKNGWVEIKEGKLKVKEKVKKYNLQDSLEKIKEDKKIDKKYLEILKKRDLIKEVKEGVEQQARKYVGKKIDNVDSSLLKTGLWRRVKFKKYNVEAKGKKIYSGKKQPYQKFLNNIKDKLLKLGFIEVRGETIVTEFWNFDALFQAQSHPSREWTQTYSLKNPKYGKLPDKKLVNRVKKTHEDGWKTGSRGWGYKWSEKKASRLVPVAHDTAISPMMLSSEDLKIPGKYFQIVRCFRPDVIDATHAVEFNQMGGFVVGKELNLKNLLGLLKQFAEEMGGAEEVKFCPDYYPFTEPSAQISVKHPKLGWMELAGAGVFREELTKPLGVEEPVIAWGIGVDRLAMMALETNDIRQLFSQDLDWLRKEKVL